MINCAMDFGFVPDNEFVELVWENGKIVMQGQSSRAKKSSFLNCPFANSPNVKERDGGDAVIPKIGKYDNLDPIMNHFSSPGPPGHVGLVEDDEMVRWLNYPFGDSSQSDYCSELFPELAESNVSCVSTQNNAVVFDKIGGHGQVGKDSHVVSPQTSGKHEHKSPSEVVGGSERSRIRSSQSFSPQQCQKLVSNIDPSGSNFNPNNSTNIHQAAFRNLTQSPPSATGMPNVKMHKKDLASTVSTEPSENTSLMNFSHFSRPVSLFKANLQGMSAASAGFSSVDRMKRNAKVSITGSNQIESSMVDLTSGSKSVVGVQNQHAPLPSKVDLRSYCKPSVELVSVGKSEATYQDDPYRNNKPPGDVLHQSSSFALSVALGVSESEKTLEPVVASSSVCSGNSTGGVSNDPKHGMKRKAREVEQSEYQSEDVEDESVDLKKPTKIPKRSRSTEVHNLSERRRRDRINEKMRALQELIPNCSKVDKASMLDDAIEYLKTLQLQVQMMSMGSGFCMPPMVLPTGIPHVSTQPMLHLPPIGVGFGMGMGAGFGMGIPDANFSPSRPMIPVTPIHGAQYPCSSVPGAANFHGMHVSGFQMFGVPGQGLPFARPCTPFIPMSGGFYTKELPVHNVSEPAIPVSVPDSTLPSKDQTENVNLQTVRKTSADSSMIQMTTQASNECSESCTLMQTYNRASLVNGNGAINIVSDNGVASTGT